MSRPLEDALIVALDLLEQGETVEQILARHPETAAQLRPYLIAAAGLGDTAVAAAPAVQQAAKATFLQHAAAIQTQPRPAAKVWLRRAAVSIVTLMLILFSGSALLGLAASEALPGDTLYGAKLLVETVRLDLSTDPQAAAEMVERLRQERVEEIAALIAANRREPVTLRGTLGEQIPAGWLVEGIAVAVNDATDVHGALESGFVVQVTGTTGDGVLAAALIEVISGRLPQAEQEPPPVVPTLPATSQPSATPRPSLTPEQQPTLTPTPPAPTAVTPTPVPAATTTPPSAGDDSSQPDDGGDDSSHSEDETPEAGHD